LLEPSGMLTAAAFLEAKAALPDVLSTVP
jgi:hypothetical protein